MVVSRLAATRLRRHAHLGSLPGSCSGRDLVHKMAGERRSAARPGFVSISGTMASFVRYARIYYKGGSNIHGWIKPLFPYNTY